MSGLNQVKEYIVPIDFTLDSGKTVNKRITFTSGDINTSVMTFKLSNNEKIVDLTGWEVIASIEREDQYTVESPCAILDAKNGIAQIVLTTSMLQVGINHLEVALAKTTTNIDDTKELISPKITYKVVQSIKDEIDSNIPNTNEYPILIKLINDVNELKNTTNAFLVEAQKKEDTRERNETTRISQENSRQTSINNMKNTFDNKIVEVNTAKNNMVSDVSNAKDTMTQDVTTAKNTMKNEVTSAKNDMVSKVNAKITEVDNSKNSMVTKVDNKIVELDDRFNALEGERAVTESKTGTYLTFDNTKDSIIQDIELQGDTIQNPNTLDIKSTGKDNGDGTWSYEIVSCGENLFNGLCPGDGYSISETDDYYILENYKTSAIINQVKIMDIKFKPNTRYTFTLHCKELSDSSNCRPVIIYTDKTEEAICFPTESEQSYTFTSSASKTISYVSFGAGAGVDTNKLYINKKRSKIQEGTIATPHTPYQETRCDIKLPCQLEKWDTLYFDKEENAWVVDKGLITNVLSEHSTVWSIYEESGINDVFFFWGKIDNAIDTDKGGEMFCNILPFEHNLSNKEYCYIGSDSNVYLAISRSKCNDVNSFKKWLKDSGVFIKYKTSKRQKIVLPLSEQIKLNSFANKTHVYSISGEVDATVKATVSKSLASTVQANTDEINILSDKVSDIEGLKESQDFAYETDKGYLICKDTQNGVVKDLKICGKSLVNRFVYASNGDDTETVKQIICKDYKNLNSGKFTIPNISNKPLRFNIYNKNNDSYIRTQAVSPRASVVVDLDRENAYLYDINCAVSDGWTSCDELKAIAMFIQGEHVNLTLNSHFEGIASVGNGNEIEVLSNNGGDLLKNSEVIKGGYYKRTDGTVFQESNSFRIENYIEVVGGMKLYSPQVCIYIAYDRNKNFISGVEISSKEDYTYEVPQNAKYIRFSFYNRLDIINQLWVSTLNKLPNVQYKQDKKPILFKNEFGEWNPITNLTEFDSIDCSKKEYTLGRYEFNINGTEDWKISSSESTITRFQLNNPKMDGNRNPLICDKLPLKTDYNDMTKEGCFTSISGTTLFIDILSSKANTVDKFKSYLSVNNMSFISRAINPIKYEINSLDLKSYDLETLVTTNSTISPKLQFKMTSSLPNFISTMSDNLADITNDVTAVKKELGDIQSEKEQAYDTDNGYISLENTSNGVIKDIKLYGKSLVNHFNVSKWMSNPTTVTANSSVETNYYKIDACGVLSSGDTVTLKIDISVDNNTNCYWQINYIDVTGKEKLFKSVDFINNTGIYLVQLPSDFSRFASIFVGVLANNVRTFKNNGCMCLKGDLTNNMPLYFEGIASVGNGNEIEVLSVKSDGNLLDVKSMKTGTILPSNGTDFDSDIKLRSDFILIPKNEKLFYNADKDNYVYFYDADKNFIISYTLSIYKNEIPNNAKYFRVICNVSEIDNDLMLSIGMNEIDYTDCKQDKKTILFKDTDNTWKPVTELNEFDEIDSTTNILYKNSLRTVITGNEQSLSMSSPSSLTNVLRFLIKIPNLDSNNTEIFCNMLKCKDGYNLDEEHCYAFGDALYFFLSKTRFTNHTVEGLKTYLSTNPLEVVVKVKGETYEINPLFPNSYENETMIFFNGGAVSPVSEFKTVTSLRKITESNSDRIDRLEDEVFKMNLANFTVALNTLDTKLRLDALSK